MTRTPLSTVKAAGQAWLRRVPTHIVVGLIATLCVIVLVLGMRAAGALETLELMTYDRLVLFRATAAGTQQRVVQIGITEDDIKRFNWPLPDVVLAKAISRLHQVGAAAIGIDIFRPASVGDGAQTLADILAKSPEVIWADRFSQSGWGGLPAPAIMQASHRNGFTDFVPDRGGIVRRGLLYLSDTRHWEEGMSLKLAFLYLARLNVPIGPDPQGNLMLGGVSLRPLRKSLGGYAYDVDTRGYQILLDFRGPNRVDTFSLADLLGGQAPAAAFRDRIVLIGSTAESVKDYFGTPLNVATEREMFGVTLQGLFAAQLVAAGLDNVEPTRSPQRGAETVLIVLLILCSGCAGTLLRSPIWFVAAMTAGTFLILSLCAAAFARGIWLPVLPMGGGWVLAGLLATAAITFVERTQRNVLMRMFSAHVSAPIAVELWKRRSEFIRHGRTIPIRLSATVLFADINDFTAASEAMEPETVVRWLSPYLDVVTSLIEQHRGVVERLAGDCVMAMFGPPVVRQHRHEILADAGAAVRFATEMRRALGELNAWFRGEGLPEMHVGIGIHSGELVSCSLGNADRQQYATIGDTTNVAARVMTVAKDWLRDDSAAGSCCIVISDATRLLLEAPPDLVTLGPIMCKGKIQPVHCHMLAADRPPKPAAGK
jgi:adenylate cyclase